MNEKNEQRENQPADDELVSYLKKIKNELEKIKEKLQGKISPDKKVSSA